MGTPQPQLPVTRRAFLQASLASGVSFLLAACGLRPSQSSATAVPSTQAAIQPAATSEPAATIPPVATAASAAATAASAAATAGVPVATTGAPVATEAQVALAPTPACGDDDEPETVAQTEGPYFTPNSPERASLLEQGISGTTLNVAGYVLTTGCVPVAGALLDFWQADDGGQYDNAGYRLRGHQFTDDQGRYALETIVPGLYPGRTRHIHVKVQAPNQPVLTTQLYFPDEPQNARDGIFSAELLMDVQPASSGKTGAFNFVLNAA